MDKADFALRGDTPDLAGSDDGVPGGEGSSELGRLPDPFAPLVKNAWYVVAERAAVGHELLAFRALGTPLVIYRTEAGDPVVLDDRCAHRRYPLSKSHRVGDTIKCGYHGFTYDKSGRCVFAPGPKTSLNFGVRQFPCVERGPWLWAWMGDPDKADIAKIPLEDSNEVWHGLSGYTFNPANYMLLIENLLDTTHLHYLHQVLADANHAKSFPKSADRPGDALGWIRDIPETRVGLHATWCGSDPERRCRRVEEATAFPPSFIDGVITRFPIEGESAPVMPGRLRVIHSLTPDDLYGTHQFWYFAFDVPLVVDDSEVLTGVRTLFNQDAEALALIQKTILRDDPTGYIERGIVTDRYGVKMRQILRQMAASESAVAERN